MNRAYEVVSDLKSTFHTINAALQKARDKAGLFAQLKAEYDLMGCDLKEIELIGENGNYEVHAYIVPRKPIEMVSFHWVITESGIQFEEISHDHEGTMETRLQDCG